MTRKPTSFLTASVQMQPFTVRISSTLKEDLRALEERIARDAPHLAFDRAQVVETALRDAVQTANDELDATKNGR